MHELSIMSNILDIVLEHANNNNAKKIFAVTLRIGVLSDVLPEWAQMYFDMLSKDTPADSAKLIIEKVPLTIRCKTCGHEKTYPEKEWDFLCRECQSTDIEIVTGRELQVSSIDVE